MDKGDFDVSDGWCCDGRTYKEHASQAGDCCQPKGQQLSDLPQDAQKMARERIAQEKAENREETTV